MECCREVTPLSHTLNSTNLPDPLSGFGQFLARMRVPRTL